MPWNYVHDDRTLLYDQHHGRQDHTQTWTRRRAQLQLRTLLPKITMLGAPIHFFESFLVSKIKKVRGINL